MVQGPLIAALLFVGSTPPIFYVRPVGEVDPSHVELACVTIQERFGVECRVLRGRPMPVSALDKRRFQYDAQSVVDMLFRDMPEDALGLMGITNADLFEASAGQFCFGLASLVDHVGIVSLARYRANYWGEAADWRSFRERYRKVLVHEVGHTLGLPHCDDSRCVMRGDRTLAELDASPKVFCNRCKENVDIGRRRVPGTADWHYIRGHSHLNRGQHAQAVYHFQRAVEMRRDDARFHNDLGVAYLRREDEARALLEFGEAVRLDPNLANAHYNAGLLFLSVGDKTMARRSFEAALGADPDWALAHRQLGYLYRETFSDERRALTHFEAYLATNGDDPSVLDQVRMIKGGGQERPGQ